MEDWLAAHPGMWTKIIIPREMKWEVRDKLDQSNINERVLFPGLDGLSQWLKRHYTPRDPERAMRAAHPEVGLAMVVER
jgi:hypothetical protein